MHNIIHILLIEDNPGDVRLIEEYLKDSNLKKYQLHHSETLAQGRQILLTKPINIILLDLQLPDSMGLSTFEKLYDEFPSNPFIVLTGLSDEKLGLRAVAKGAQDFLNKNELNGQLLGRAISYAIERNQLVRGLETAQQLAKMGNWQLYPRSNHLQCSPQLYTIFEKGKGVEFTTLEDYIVAIHPEDQQTIARAFHHAITTGGEIKVDHRILFPDGSVKFIELQGKPELGPDGNLMGLIGTTQDITDRKQVEKLRQQKELATKTAKLRQDFLAKTSHEIRTPLNPILVLTDMLLKTDLSQDQREHLNAIKTAGETLLAVVNDILDLAKIEAGKIDFNRHNFSINQVFDSIKDMMDLNAREKDLDLLVQIDPKIPSYLIGDTVRLTQILLNLVGNSIKFTHKGHIRVSARLIEKEAKKANIEFVVKDTGIGIPKDKLKVIFESFQQIEGDSNRRYGGTGLGLTIVKQLVLLQGGNISVESRPGEGSTFTFNLNFDLSPSNQAAYQEKVFVDKNLLKGMGVLLVEDNPLNQLVTKKLLNDWGIDLEIANNGREAIEKLKEDNYDLVLMDLQMPEMDGVEATHYIRNFMDAPAREVPIIALTANAFSGTDDECLKVGMNDYISKPIEINSLYSKVLLHGRSQRKKESPKPYLNGNGENGSYDAVQVANSSMSTSQYTDLSYLQELSGGDTNIISKTIDKFLETTPDILNSMDQHLAHADHRELGRAAHKLKSSVAFFGIDSIKETILSIEKITKFGDGADQLPDLVTKVRSVIEQSYLELRGALNSL